MCAGKEFQVEGADTEKPERNECLSVPMFVWYTNQRCKTDEPLEMLSGGGGAHSCGHKGPYITWGVHIGATWRIRLIISDAAAMRRAVTITVATF